ncbi:MAG: thermonuclease family protein [Bacteroidia bacterium]|jgi:endonuclease YncB( thermonuclease family)|nr:thermonuclease family protein [Bacteroidia bacterium]
MKHLFLFFTCCVLLASAQKPALVTRVVDGDTYDLFYNSKRVRVRIAHIDAPELKQAFGKESALQVNQLLYRRIVIFDSLGKDLYGRVVGNLLLNGKRVDSLLVRFGLAWYKPAYGEDPILASCMLLAVNEGKGLWACGVEVVCPPWLYRTYNYENRLRYCRGCSINNQSTFKN